MERNYLRGHEVILLYKDTLTPTAGNPRPCGHCGMNDTKEGHDGCLGTLLGGVMNACCGHGQENQAYVQFWGGKILCGNIAKNWIEKSKTLAESKAGEGE